MKKPSIPNEVTYRILIPEDTIYRFKGNGDYEETLEDHFMYCIVQPLREKGIPFEFSFGESPGEDGFEMYLKVDGAQFEEMSMVANIDNEGLRMGLKVHKCHQGEWVTVYDDSRRSQYKI